MGWLDRLSRRRFVSLGLLALLHPRVVLAQQTDDPARKTVRTLCDHFIPAHGASPGALAVGVDVELLEGYRRSRARRLVLELVVRELEKRDFLASDRAQQEALLRRFLQGDVDSPAAPYLRQMLDLVVQRYYTRPAAWKALDYHAPQPGGYPDYATCRVADGET